MAAHINEEQMYDSASLKEVEFWIQCSSCQDQIRSYRYKCLECNENYNLCGSCFERRKYNINHKKNHILLRFDQRETIFGMRIPLQLSSLDDWKNYFANEVHSDIQCKICSKKPIKGVLLRCDECLDRMCLGCQKKHSINHPLILNPRTLSFEVERSSIVLTERDLGKGAQGSVVEAELNQKICACKIFHKNTINESPDSTTQNAQQELTAFRNVIGVNIVRMIGFSNADNENELWILMELMEENLKNLLDNEQRRNNLSYLDRFCIVADIAAGLARLHMLNYAHNDLHSRNILLRGNIAKISDLGSSEAFIPADKKEKKKFEADEIKNPASKIRQDIKNFGEIVNNILDLGQNGGTDSSTFFGQFVDSCKRGVENLQPKTRSINEIFYQLRRKLESERINSTNISIIDFQQKLSNAERNLSDLRETEIKDLLKLSSDSILKYFKKRLEDIGGDSLIAKNLRIIIADVHYEKREPDKALEFYNEALEKASKCDDDEDLYMISDCNESIGNVHLKLKGDPEKGLKYHEEALEIRKRIFDKSNEKDVHRIKIASSFKSIGDCHYQLENYKDALIYFGNALEIKKMYYNGQLELIETLSVRECMQECYQKLREVCLANKIQTEYKRNIKSLVNNTPAFDINTGHKLIRESLYGRYNWSYFITQDGEPSIYRDLKREPEHYEQDPPDFVPDEDDHVLKFLLDNLKCSWLTFNRESNLYTLTWLQELFIFFEKGNEEKCESSEGKVESYSQFWLHNCIEFFENERIDFNFVTQLRKEYKKDADRKGLKKNFDQSPLSPNDLNYYTSNGETPLSSEISELAENPQN